MTDAKKAILKNGFVDTDETVNNGGRRRSSRKNHKKSVRRVKSAKRTASKSRKYRNRK